MLHKFWKSACRSIRMVSLPKPLLKEAHIAMNWNKINEI